MSHATLVYAAARTPARRARDLSDSTGFRLACAWAEAYGDPWYVLSARHGLLRPDDTPLRARPTPTDAVERSLWAWHVACALEAAEPHLTHATTIAPRWVATALHIHLIGDVYVDDPLRGLDATARRAWLSTPRQPIPVT